MVYAVGRSAMVESFSALQRAEIAEIFLRGEGAISPKGFSALQRAEIAEMRMLVEAALVRRQSFSALQRAEIAEIRRSRHENGAATCVSVLFNEPKLLKLRAARRRR